MTLETEAPRTIQSGGPTEPIAGNLERHVEYLARADDQIPSSLTQGRCSLPGLLSRVERRRLSLTEDPPAFRLAYAQARQMAAEYLAGIAEIDFPPPPRPEEWIARSLDGVNMQQTYRRARLEFERFLRAGNVPGVRLSGGVKDRAAVLRKIAAREIQEGALDLWDNVRLRMIAPDLHGVVLLSSGLLRKFGGRVVRVRNYYVRPRQGRNDPYRAVHFEVRGDDGQFVEMQVMTALREALGVIDHILVHRRAVPFLNHRHEQWLMELSQTANIIDAEEASARSHEDMTVPA
jgi:ppGpp synthetase/RelA/SpoT-type nucleotidyltranferase